MYNQKDAIVYLPTHFPKPSFDTKCRRDYGKITSLRRLIHQGIKPDDFSYNGVLTPSKSSAKCMQARFLQQTEDIFRRQ